MPLRLVTLWIPLPSFSIPVILTKHLKGGLFSSPVPATLWEKPRTRAGKEAAIPHEIPDQAPQELLQSPVAQSAEALGDAVVGLGSLQLEDNLMEEGETASSSLSPDSSPLGEETQPKVGGSPEEAEPAEDAPREGVSAEGSSAEVMAPDKEVSTAAFSFIDHGFTRLLFSFREYFSHQLVTALAKPLRACVKDCAFSPCVSQLRLPGLSTDRAEN